MTNLVIADLEMNVDLTKEAMQALRGKGWWKEVSSSTSKAVRRTQRLVGKIGQTWFG